MSLSEVAAGVSFVDVASALFTVSAAVVGLLVTMRGLVWILNMVNDKWVDPVDPEDPNDPRNYDWNDDNDPDGDFH